MHVPPYLRCISTPHHSTTSKKKHWAYLSSIPIHTIAHANQQRTQGHSYHHHQQGNYQYQFTDDSDPKEVPSTSSTSLGTTYPGARRREPITFSGWN